MPKDCLSDPEEASLMCGLGVAVWLQEEACQVSVGSHGCVALGCLLAAG